MDEVVEVLDQQPDMATITYEEVDQDPSGNVFKRKALSVSGVDLKEVSKIFDEKWEKK